MAQNVVHLPRPHAARAPRDPFGLFVRVGRNDHLELLDLIATGERGIFGFVIEAQNVERHHELITEALRHNFDVVLDPKTQPMGLPGGYTDSLSTLPWGGDRHHKVADFDGDAGREKAKQIVEFAITNGFTQLLGPTHLLSTPNDPWVRRDIAMMQHTADTIAVSGKKLRLIYSLALPMVVFRRKDERHAVLTAIEDAPCDSIWLKVEHFGRKATGEKTAAYIEGCRELHERKIPIVGDHIGGLPGLGALAFGAVGGMAHGVTVNEEFSASNWRRPPSPNGFATSRRVYLPQLDMLMKPEAADALLRTSTRIRALCGCHDTHCCPHGVKDMTQRPVRHALYQRAREIEQLSDIAPSFRTSRYMDDRVRRVSDAVASIASAPGLPAEAQQSMMKKQSEMSLFRQAMGHLAESAVADSVAMPPRRRHADIDQGRE
jgi:hypothetical protein